MERPARKEIPCFHCGTACATSGIKIEDKTFCCEGCRLVYEILENNGLCDYYKLENHPGLSQVKPVRNDKYAYLDDEKIAAPLYKFTDGRNVLVTLYIPGIHCSSCMWLLEHLPRLNPGITESRLNFSAKEVTIRFVKDKVSLRQIVELLTTIGYEPYISLDDTNNKKVNKLDKSRIYKLGVAGFCFGNIMMLSFPEYLSGDLDVERQYASLFRVLNLLLSVPVFFYAASEFFTTAWAGIRQRMLNIDAPIALAIVITFVRSLYEILSGTGAGYLDSMSGIVFFMLVGRVVQERTYRSISFHRDYKAYFPIAVNVVTSQGKESRKITELKEKDVVELYNDEIIPADALVVNGTARIDYSFVTGESEPVSVPVGQMVYAGGKQIGSNLTIQIVKPVAGSYLTSLWNHHAFTNNKIERNKKESILHTFSKYFTMVLFSLAALTALYWAIYDPSKILPAVSAMLIVACPCALLLSATYTNGNILRILSNNGLYLRDATIIEQLGKVDHIVFDKTGTLTGGGHYLDFMGYQLTEEDKDIIAAVTAASKHPYSIAISRFLGPGKPVVIDNWQELPGKGIKAHAAGREVLVGSADHTGVIEMDSANIYIKIGEDITACYISPRFREDIPRVIPALQRGGYQLSVLSGDNNKQEQVLRNLFGDESQLRFGQKPIDKLQYIETLQQKSRVAMIGDGLNDAGALQQSNVGITLSDDINNFSPSCDAILDASQLRHLPALLQLSKSAARIINLAFFISILYNTIGLTLSMQARMSPMLAAILMPASTISIVLIATGVSSLQAKKLKLSLSNKTSPQK